MHVGGRYYRDAVHDVASLGRYINIKMNGNASLVCYPYHACRFEANQRIPPQTQIFSTYGVVARRGAQGCAISVSDLPNAPDASQPQEQQQDQMEHKYDESQVQLHDSDVALMEIEPTIG